MTFANPEFLAVAPLVMLLLLLALLAQRRRLRLLASAYGDAAIERLMPADANRFPTARLVCLVLAGLAICVAASGPGVTTNRGSSAPASLDIAIVVDVSLSMSATDIAPTRIERAREVVIRLSKEVPKARLSLVLLGDWPYTLAGPTDDPNVVAYFAQSLTGALISGLSSSIRTSRGDQSASLQAGIAHAREALDSRPLAGAERVILVISDGAIPGSEKEVVSSVAAVAGKGVVVWTAGIGTTGGGKAPAVNDLVDMAGQPVGMGFDEQLLRAVARAGGGIYEDVSNDRGLRALVSGLRRVGGVSSPEDVGPERVTFWLGLLSVLILLWEGAADVGKYLVLGRAKKDLA